MKHVHFFQYNIPADNHLNGNPDVYVNILAEWDSESLHTDGRPIVHVSPVNFSFYELIIVKNWLKAKIDIEKLAEDHFAELAKAERINQARAIAYVEENPILDRYPF